MAVNEGHTCSAQVGYMSVVVTRLEMPRDTEEPGAREEQSAISLGKSHIKKKCSQKTIIFHYVTLQEIPESFCIDLYY